jgi:hypothetical protein
MKVWFNMYPIDTHHRLCRIEELLRSRHFHHCEASARQLGHSALYARFAAGPYLAFPSWGLARDSQEVRTSDHVWPITAVLSLF